MNIVTKLGFGAMSVPQCASVPTARDGRETNVFFIDKHSNLNSISIKS